MAACALPAPPAELRGRLVFGDVEQIKALRAYESVVSDYTEGDLAQWEVYIEVTASQAFKVFARSKREAESLGKLEVKYMLDDADVFVRAERVG